MELEHLDVFLDDMGGSTVLFIANQLLVGLNNVCQLVCEIILCVCVCVCVCVCT